MHRVRFGGSERGAFHGVIPFVEGDGLRMVRMVSPGEGIAVLCHKILHANALIVTELENPLSFGVLLEDFSSESLGGELFVSPESCSLGPIPEHNPNGIDPVTVPPVFEPPRCINRSVGKPLV